MSSLLKNSFVILLISFSLVAFADPGGQGHGKGQGQGHGHGAMKAVGHGHGVGHSAKSMHSQPPHSMGNKAKGPKTFAKFSTNDSTTIRNYYKTNPASATALPPGIAMNLARGKPLPPGIAKRYLPNDLVTQLPAYPGYEYRLVGNDAVLVNSTTGIVSDIIANVLK